jgi:HKD family nuclease
MKLEIIENRGPNNLRDTLVELLKKSSDVCIGVAFVTSGGLNDILGALQGLAARGRARIVVGLYQSVTEPQALYSLLRIQQLTKGNISVRLSREPGFHRKMYLLKHRSVLNAILGSSNLTKEGLISGGELNSLISFKADSAHARRIRKVFEEEWSVRRSLPLTKARIDAYAKRRGRQKGSSSLTKQDLQAILGASPLHEAGAAPAKRVAYWRTCISGFAKESTSALVSQETDWDRRQLQWFTCWTPPKYSLRDRIAIIDFPKKNAYLAEVCDTVRMPVYCSDGRHFVAYRSLRNRVRKLTDKLWRELREQGVTKKAAKDSKKLNESQWLALEQVLKR